MDKVDHVHSRLIAFYVICKQDFSTYGVKNPESWTLPSTEKRRSEGERASVSKAGDFLLKSQTMLIMSRHCLFSGR